MKEKLEDAMFLIEDAKNAMEELGIVPKIHAFKGRNLPSGRRFYPAG